MEKIIYGIQQIGIGNPDVYEATHWYSQYFGMDIKMFEDSGPAPFMTPYTGGEIQDRTAILTLNMRGGGGFEIWQYTSRTPVAAEFELQLGDLGICCAKIKSVDVTQTHEKFTMAGLNVLTPLKQTPSGELTFFLKDLNNNIWQVVKGLGFFKKNEKKTTGGAGGAIIGSANIDKARKLYTDILGYDEVVYDETAIFEDFANLPGGEKRFRRVLLRNSKAGTGGFSKLLGPTEIELVEVKDRKPKKIFENRYWGDLGFIHLCFDVHGMDILKKECEEAGFPFTVDSANSFDMGEAAGRFTYIEDPDGTLIEFVETHKVPILKKFGWYLDMTKKDPKKNLPDWMLGALSFSRMKE